MAGPATAVPSAAPAPNVVTSQESASGHRAERSVPVNDVKAQATAGASDTPAGIVRTVITVAPGESISGR
jgi:hypothetical protein